MKCYLFEEIKEGFDALAQKRQGKLTLCTHAVSAQDMEEVTADEIRRLRDQLNLSRPVLSEMLRTNPRTLEI